MATTDATFRAGGLASGLDTNSIIDQLVTLESQPITLVRKRQTAMQTQVSTLGDLISKLGTLNTAAQNLGTSGAVGTTVTSAATGFGAVSGSAATAGIYDVQVNAVARAATARSQAFDTATSPVRGGTLTLSVNGTDYTIPHIDDGTALSDVALAIRQSGAPVSAVVLSNGSKSYLSVTNRNTGFTTPTSAGALVLTMTPDDSATAGQVLAVDPVPGQDAANSSVSVNGLTFTRQSNTVTDAIPGVTLTLRAPTTASEQLVVDNDASGTAKNLQTFVDAYNSVMKVVSAQMNVSASTDRTTRLTGDSALRDLQQKMQALLVTQVGSGSVRTMADLGIKTAQTDGTITLDSNVLAAAIGRDAGAVNDLFSKASTGLSAATQKVVNGATDIVSGSLVTRQASITKTISALDDEAATLQRRVDSFRNGLIAEFTNMEQVVSNLKNIGSFLTQQSGGSSGTGK